MLVAIPRIWVELGSGSADGDWHADRNEVKLNNCNIGKNVMQTILRPETISLVGLKIKMI